MRIAAITVIADIARHRERTRTYRGSMRMNADQDFHRGDAEARRRAKSLKHGGKEEAEGRDLFNGAMKGMRSFPAGRLRW